jgi:hypothetical protein
MMNNQINPSPELVNKVIDSINVLPKKHNLIKYAIPMLLLLIVFCLPLMNNSVTTDTGNRFLIAAYAAEDTTFEITKDVKTLLPAGTWKMEPRDGGVNFSWRAKLNEAGEPIPGGFTIIGENIKSVNVESKYGSFVDALFLRYGTDEELNERFREQGSYEVNPVYLEGKSILDLSHFLWKPNILIMEDKEYMDIIKVTVTFNDGEVIIQTVQITVDKDTGNIYAQITE